MLLAAALFAAGFAYAQQRLVDPSAADSAQPAAMRILRHLADGDIEAAARLSNAPQRRLEVLRDYRSSVGDEEFKRVFSRYVVPQNRVVAEVAYGPRRLLVWDLGEAGNRLTGQFYIERDGAFVMDDVPDPARSELQRILGEYRSGIRGQVRNSFPRTQ